MFSLCIPTLNRFDTFLSKYIPKYLDNNLIDEIIVSDENGNDYDKIQSTFQNSKLRLFKNNTILGPFLNKLTACKYAKNKWIVLIDSDNFADEDYFRTAKEFIESNTLGDNTILSPSWAKPRFDYRHLSGLVFNKSTHIKIYNFEQQTRPQYNSEILMNTGNYVINKYLIDNIDLSNEQQNISESSACDVIYMNTLFFEQLDAQLYVVPNMFYDHVIHNGSIYIQTHQRFSVFNNIVYNRYKQLRK